MMLYNVSFNFMKIECDNIYYLSHMQQLSKEKYMLLYQGLFQKEKVKAGNARLREKYLLENIKGRNGQQLLSLQLG